MIQVEAKAYKNDIGHVITVDTGEDLSSATKVSLKVRKPDNSEFEWLGTVYQTTKIRYTTVIGDLDQMGTYRFQGYVELPTFTGRTETFSWKIYDNFAG